MYMNSQMKRYIGLGLGESQSTEAYVHKELGYLISGCGWMCSLTYLDALQTLHNWDFMETSSLRQDQLLTLFPAPLPSLEKVGFRRTGVLKMRRL